MSADADEMDTMTLIRLLLPRVSEVPATEVDETTRIADLDVDSLRWMELLAEMEDRLAIMVSDEEMIQIRTVGDVVELIDRRRANAGAASS
jgi:acyl carrier protein